VKDHSGEECSRPKRRTLAQIVKEVISFLLIGFWSLLPKQYQCKGENLKTRFASSAQEAMNQKKIGAAKIIVKEFVIQKYPRCSCWSKNNAHVINS